MLENVIGYIDSSDAPALEGTMDKLRDLKDRILRAIKKFLEWIKERIRIYKRDRVKLHAAGSQTMIPLFNKALQGAVKVTLPRFTEKEAVAEANADLQESNEECSQMLAKVSAKVLSTSADSKQYVAGKFNAAFEQLMTRSEDLVSGWERAIRNNSEVWADQVRLVSQLTRLMNLIHQAFNMLKEKSQTADTNVNIKNVKVDIGHGERSAAPKKSSTGATNEPKKNTFDE